ncbi:GtrA family protein [Polaromonas sp.]|uniref:GtrA family protein n=1 Tax=Polaromonas sp. TaxID=1869339 RepID=UPI002FCC4187
MPGLESFQRLQRKVLGWRFSRFAVVGGLGTLVNLLVLYVAQEWLLRGLDSLSLRLFAAQLLAITAATAHNFCWNRYWTWVDRPKETGVAVAGQFIRYAVAGLIGITLQLICVQWLGVYVHYLVAASIAIVLAAGLNYFINDIWIFARAEVAGQQNKRILQASLVALTLVTVGVYFSGIESRYIPKNGDENVYFHITRVTAGEGAWLPLKSELNEMRNTKPPLLLWQGMVSTDWGGQWQAWRLRAPNVLYTLLTAWVVGWLAARLACSTPTGWIAALCWLAFLSTYRYGRPFLTTAPEVFWLFTPLAWLLGNGQRAFESRWRMPLLVGLMWGVASLYKSFALLVPAAASLGLMCLARRNWNWRECLALDAPKWLASGVLALLVFGLWFALDPQPQDVWREFVLGENVGKLDADGSAYLKNLLIGDGGVGTLFIAFLSNAGLLLFPWAALLVHAWRQRKQLPPAQKWLWLWVIVWFVIFALPSQRSARYLIPVMPAIAVLLALNWLALARWSFVSAHLLALAMMSGLIFLGWSLNANASVVHFGWFTALVWGLTIFTAFAGVLSSRLTRYFLLAAAVGVFASFACLVTPLSRSDFSPDAQSRVAGKTVAIPCNFRAQYEEAQFSLPAARILGYQSLEPQTEKGLSERADFFVWRTGVSDPAPQCSDCEVVGSRLGFRTRHSSAELKGILRGEFEGNLFIREWLVKSGANARGTPTAVLGACR